jgi:hypothetical protein
MINIFKYKENWLIVLKSSARKIFLTIGSTGKTVIGPQDKVFWTTLVSI